MVISHKPLKIILAILIAFLPSFGFSNTPINATQTTDSKEVVVDEKSEVKAEILEVINHHVLDGHDFSLFEYEGKHIGFSLPIILWDNGVHFFSSSKFHHGEAVAESNGNYYVLHHEKIYKSDAAGKVLVVEAKEIKDGKEVVTEKELQPIDLSITKGVLTIMIVALLMFFIFTSLARSYAKNGGISSGFGRLFEPIVIYIRDEIAIPNIGEKHYKKYMSYLLTIFFFIWFLNIFGLTPLGINVTGNIAITFGLAVVTFIITNVTANKNYWGHIFWMPGVPLPMKIILAPIELLGVFIKPFSLMIRLYANIFAGHIVLMSLIGLMFIFKNWLGSSLSFMLSFAISTIEILVALLQAYIFTMLSALYFGSAVEEHHHEEAH
ncbi:MAG: ATP synthase F0 subunit A [Flavobacteriaceae bacterium]|jgi:F-type H+-transporting ATPase subunit a|nr:ATP synthase F0 subunit A [Flavobacteriaceae bacterium]